MRIGLIIGGSDCQGMNAAIRAVVKTAEVYDIEVLGYRGGFDGILQNKFVRFNPDDASGLLDKGGSIIGTSAKCMLYDNPDNLDEYVAVIKKNMQMFDVGAIIAIGGDTTIGMCNTLSAKGINVICIPKSGCDEICCTGRNLGFMSTVEFVTECIDNLHTNAESNHHVTVLEVMGDRVGTLALEAGMAGGADVILIPEIKYSINKVAHAVLTRKNHGKNFSIVLVAEGAMEQGQEAPVPNTGEILASKLSELTGVATDLTVLGKLQKGGRPNAYDRILATRQGAAAVEAVRRGDFGTMVGVDGRQVYTVGFEHVVGKFKYVEETNTLVEIARKMKVCFGD
ncbi:MAG: ATP-dependent 6-phosphofructokinase [Clostridia bacterium]|nr:ATP-dependent 6-phosphofructokinase [Clostridia bacterium]